MDSWTAHTPSPSIKFENSPTESLLSAPADMYPSLFGSDSSATMNPLEIMTPRSTHTDCDHDLSVLSGFTRSVSGSEPPETPGANTSSDKKPTKKRKSWGQVLPEPKTNLPPRKRAKTEDEKEQRRVERVLRNRRAAQSSRERKRQEVEGLEQRTKQLEELLRQSEARNQALLNELQKVAGASLDGLKQSPVVTFSQPLFSSQDGHNTSSQSTDIDQLLSSFNSTSTVNPASLSPTLTPVPEEQDEEDQAPYDEPSAEVALSDAATTKMVNASPDATQRPAEMLCQDLQCPSAEAPPSKWLAASQTQLHPVLSLLLPLQIFLTSTSTLLSLCQRPLMQIAMSVKAGFSLPPTQAILSTIISVVTTPSTSRRPSTSTSTTSSTPTSSSRSNNLSAARPQSRRSSTLRLKYLRKILTSSPNLARPLMDATMEALRLVSSDGYAVNQVPRNDDALTAAAADGTEQRLQQRPSREILLTLLWALKVEERRLEIRRQVSEQGRSSVQRTMALPPNQRNYVLKVLPKRKGTEKNDRPNGRGGLKRPRFS
ncbi:hypothetical protein B0H66DRAFT_95043 [Apodospora peruviana]|uniref:BZIP domain-containing protein n=1 Tax=Apodospora peruviana TaxID=516989 RepID=A0AAE0IUC0_9PEZI|nr:hypothetical protein B0H66DRAFT_95043 [Apodospora peruviana]